MSKRRPSSARPPSSPALKDLLCFCNPVRFSGDTFPILADENTDCPRLLKVLDRHQLDSLAYRHLNEAGKLEPEALAFGLRGGFIQNRYANRVRMEALEQLILEGRKENIEFLVLKGAATANLVYPDPALRPMKDLDLLVHPAQIEPATRLLLRLGYEQHPPSGEREVKHVPDFTRRDREVLVAVELHYDLYDGFWNPSRTWDDLGPGRSSFNLGSTEAAALPPEDLMEHAWRHLLEEEKLRLIWIADLVGCAETYVDSLDWNRLRRDSAGLLSLLEMVAPEAGVSLKLRERLGPGLPFPDSMAKLQLRGWPRSKSSDWPGRRSEFFIATFWPPAHRLAISHGESGGVSRILNRLVFHPVQLLAWAFRRLRIRLEKAEDNRG